MCFLSETKLTQVKFRLNEEELALWQEKAEERHLSLPRFSKQIVNKVITQGKLKQPKINKEQWGEVIRHLAKLGGNVNQIAKWCNTHQTDVTDKQRQQLTYNLERVQEELKVIWQQLK